MTLFGAPIASVGADRPRSEVSGTSRWAKPCGSLHVTFELLSAPILKARFAILNRLLETGNSGQRRLRFYSNP
jgi:hypothetical protein